MKLQSIKQDLVNAGVIDPKTDQIIVKQQRKTSKAGQPTKLTRQREKVLIANIKQGTPINVACKEVGITRACLDAWFTYALQGKEKFIRFFLRLDSAAAELEGSLARRVAADPDWRALAFILERLFAERWGKEPAIAIQVNIEQAAGRVAEREGVDPKQLEAITGQIIDESEDD